MYRPFLSGQLRPSPSEETRTRLLGVPSGWPGRAVERARERSSELFTVGRCKRGYTVNVIDWSISSRQHSLPVRCKQTEVGRSSHSLSDEVNGVTTLIAWGCIQVPVLYEMESSRDRQRGQ